MKKKETPRYIRIEREEERFFSGGLSNHRITPVVNVSSPSLFSSICSNDALLVDDSTPDLACGMIAGMWSASIIVPRMETRDVSWEHIASHKAHSTAKDYGRE